ncbi:MAG: hypothetical protein CVU42_07615 [Chloroflexi bacterium HGW-Chloroflexi-4]|jgi:hypothetical protein|nr:MAG: hypothetical protein CVU42_07615 [Chloroflexi bacterium HGW-Chloroflexi-4]
MEFNFIAALMAFFSTGLVYLVIVLRMKKKNQPIIINTHNLIIAGVAVFGTYYIFAGVLGLIG